MGRQPDGRLIGATDFLPGWADTDLSQVFTNEFDLPLTVLNDGHAMGIAEARLGAGRGHRLCVTVPVGTGIGGAITVDGRLFGGTRGGAGAIGHVAVREGGPACSCGPQGCIEPNASGPAMAIAYTSRLGADTDNGNEIDLRRMVAALSGANVRAAESARSVVESAGARLGRAIAGVANVIDRIW